MSEVKEVITKQELQAYLDKLPDDAKIVLKSDGYYDTDIQKYMELLPNKDGEYVLIYTNSGP